MNTPKDEHVLRALKKGVRYDGRKLLEFRNVSIEANASRNAEGSARVKLGKTEVIVGVKLSVEKPYADRPENGNLMVNAELLPLSSSEYEPGPPKIKSILTARVIDRGIREAEAIDTSKLCIEPGEKVWGVIVDICAINDDGNILDAAALGAVAALKNARYPHFDKEKNEVDYHKKTDKGLPIIKEPLPVTMYKIGEHLLVDPLPEEERIADARLTIGTIASGHVVSLQKGGQAAFTIDEIRTMVGVALEHSNTHRGLL